MCIVELLTNIYCDGSQARQPYYHLCKYSIANHPCPDTRVRDLGQRYVKSAPPWPLRLTPIPPRTIPEVTKRIEIDDRSGISKASDTASRSTDTSSKVYDRNGDLLQRCPKVMFNLYPFRKLSKKESTDMKKDSPIKTSLNKKVPPPAPEPPAVTNGSAPLDSEQYLVSYRDTFRSSWDFLVLWFRAL